MGFSRGGVLKVLEQGESPYEMIHVDGIKECMELFER